jgi:hypothetical protein
MSRRQKDGLFRSTNNADSWQQVYSGDPMQEIALHNTILFAVSSGAVWRSIDHGHTWSQSTFGGRSGGPYVISVNEPYIFLGGDDLSRSSDDGVTWAMLHPDPVSDIASHDSLMLFPSFRGIFESTDYGENWQQLPNLLNWSGPIMINGKHIFVNRRQTSNDGRDWEDFAKSIPSTILCFGPK